MGTQRIQTRFAALAAEKRPGLITFTMAFDPDRAISLEMLKALPAAGADIIEIGMPFSDPMADGKTIQEAGIRALDAGASLAGVLDLVRAFRETDQTTPLILMGYLNPIEQYGYARFAADAAQVGLDGTILVDLPPEEDAELRVHMTQYGLAMVRLIAPATQGERLRTVLTHADGFVYTVAVAGITGGKSADEAFLTRQVAAIQQHTAVPVAVGFGIRTAEQARRIAATSGAQGVVVGSALVDVLYREGLEAAKKLVRELAAALRQ